MKKIAVYAGTLDPTTLGHLWVVQEASLLFDEVIVAIGINAEKKTMFSIDERLEILRDSVKQFPNVRVGHFEKKYLVKYAVSVGASYIIRGIRNSTDFEYERVLKHFNNTIEPKVTTIFLMPPKHLAETSSSIVKNLIGPDGWEEEVGSLVPMAAFAKILNREHAIWHNLVAYGAQGDGLGFWYGIIGAYTQEHRAYHTLGHISAMLRDFGEVKDLLTDPLAVEMAIWMHDIWYDTHSHKNEEFSAESASTIIRTIGLPDAFGEKVSQLILATTHDSIPTDADNQYLVDIDLAILGQDSTTFDEYEKSIKKEYEWVPQNTYIEERTKILQRFLDRPAIYSTEFFRTKYEKAARENIERSIKALQQ